MGLAFERHSFGKTPIVGHTPRKGSENMVLGFHHKRAFKGKITHRMATLVFCSSGGFFALKLALKPRQNEVNSGKRAWFSEICMGRRLTGDVTWDEAAPTYSVDAAQRGG